jgi:heme/copper-type cytochrome/quinol oxidase subunit 4
MRKSILLNVSSSKTIARFEAEFDVTKACFFVVILSSTDLCVHWSVLIHLYGDDTVQVSILYECSLLIEWCTVVLAIWWMIYM